MLGWVWCGVGKKHTGTCYAKLPFLHPVGSMGHVVHSGASRRETSTRYFYARVGPMQIPQKGHRIRYMKHVFLHPVGSVGHEVHCGASGP
jgi:hypothetical protein